MYRYEYVNKLIVLGTKQYLVLLSLGYVHLWTIWGQIWALQYCCHFLLLCVTTTYNDCQVRYQQNSKYLSFIYKNNFVTWIYKLYQNHYFNRTTMSVEMGIM